MMANLPHLQEEVLTYQLLHLLPHLQSQRINLLRPYPRLCPKACPPQLLGQEILRDFLLPLLLLRLTKKIREIHVGAD